MGKFRFAPDDRLVSLMEANCVADDVQVLKSLCFHGLHHVYSSFWLQAHFQCDVEEKQCPQFMVMMSTHPAEVTLQLYCSAPNKAGKHPSICPFLVLFMHIWTFPFKNVT